MMESIMQDIKECFLCREEMIENNNFKRLPSSDLECHHIMHGTANRKISEHYGLKVWLCQKRFEQIFSHEEWMNLFMKNYL